MKIILSILISAVVFGGGIYYWQDLNIEKLEIKFEEEKALIINERDEAISSYRAQTKVLDDTKDVLEQTKWRNENTALVFDIVKDTYFVPKPTNSTLLSVAILLNDEEVCESISDGEKEFCHDIFDDNCKAYEYPNLEICEDFRVLLDRKVDSAELIKYCNSKDKISNDMSQAHCFQRFAKATSNVNLCYEICKSPIDNTNCMASCRDENNELISCKDQYIEDCVEYTL
ncbi:MAG: hypothetical protein HOE19_03985 [Candidatus Komeilibacteria bacterium]|jgi:hypothetical protein|nr:hypothetical protein [Candidatus Komeilibacteria bacterium]MBT4447834.1 hypothetical protein [Candidatus Komeilibacteria bacterium]